MTMPAAGQQVAVVVPEVGRLLGKVDKVSKDSVVIALQSGQKGNVAVLGSNAATLVFNTGRGVHRLQGSVRRSALRASTLRFELAGDARTAQRRTHVRVDAVLSVTLFRRERGGDRVQTYTHDIYGGGLAVVNNCHLAVGETLGVSLDLGNGSPRMSMTCRVARRIDAKTVGLHIERISSPERERLIQYIFVRQRAALRMAKGP
jgi:c-di-GMP-binding flagellar brake protein YcgR